MVNERAVNLICISKTWLSSHFLDVFVNILNYRIHILVNGRGAGVCIYGKQPLNPTQIVTTPGERIGVEDAESTDIPRFLIPHLNIYRISINAYTYTKKSTYVLSDLSNNLIYANSK